jgi:integrase
MSTFQQVAQSYLEHSAPRVKPSTARAELSCISRVLDHGGFAETPCCEVGCLLIEAYQNKRLESGVKPSTINTELVILSKVFDYALKRGEITINPCKFVKRLKTNKPERRFLTNEEISRICDKCSPSLFNYLKFLQYTGAREQEALKVRWSDVDFKARKVCIGADGNTKNGKSRCVEFSEALRVHLETMFNNLGENVFLFPKFGAGHVKSFRDQFDYAKTHVGLHWVGFHDFRRHFVSQCVMSGIDFATIAKWCGHSDGGALLAKKYAFLANDYVVKQAAKLKF